ncbi:MAG: MIP family channel protein [Clostridia bacterium]|nr:MIP family channel protein [Clostridia bacterium]
MKKYVAEFIGTAVLVLFGCGAAVTANTLLNGAGVASPLAYSTLLIAFAFGLVIVAMAYSVGNVSGCHINPAVSLSMLITGKITVKDFIGYIVAQILGATAGAAILLAISGKNGIEQGLGTNSFSGSATGLTMWGAIAAEIILTFVFVYVILGVTSKKEYGSVAGLVIGLTLTLVHIFGIPLTGTSVNPARSFGPALILAFTGNTTPLSEVWVFIIAPLAGAALASAVFILLHKAENK